MDRTAVRDTQVDYADVQGIVRFGYGKMTEAAYLLARVKNPAAARSWLRSAPVANAVKLSSAPTTAMQVAFTAPGLAALGVSSDVIASFSREFKGGMAEANRVRRAGDVAGNAPADWDWGWDGGNGSGTAGVPHIVVMLFAEPSAGLNAFMARAMGDGFHEAFDVIRRLDANHPGGEEPFGFADGLSQPEIDWDRERDPSAMQLEYSNQVALGEFLLGYPNEYGKYTERPLLAADGDNSVLLPAEDAPDKRDLGRNGTYLVMRQLRQDVRKFWQFTAKYTADAGDLKDAEPLASAFVGRTRTGKPLVLGTENGKSGDDAQNEFTFDDDPSGARCPFGAHIRRVNPRNGDLPGKPTGLARLIAMVGLGRRNFREDLTSSVRYHRILRRGRGYGPKLSPTDALAPAPADDPERGLYFICLNANISRQFEFLQSAWVMNTKFAALTGASDPLIGNREPFAGCPAAHDFTMEQDGSARRRVTGLPQFVAVRGGAYFFLPSLRALRYFAAE